MFPSNDFITKMFNIRESDIENFAIFEKNGETVFEVTLKRKPMICPYCHMPAIGNGHILKRISHPILRDTTNIIMYHANRYLCKYCNKTFYDTNPFALPAFNSSHFLVSSVMKKLKNLNYTLRMISDELNISPTQVNKYLDSYIIIPNRKLPECIGIDELYSPVMSRKNASYLCVIVDNEKRGLYEILDSRSKEYLSSFFASRTREERANVKYVTIDMWEPYKDVVHAFLPNAIVAVDPFHVIEHLTRDFERLRVSLMKQCIYDSNGYYLLKHWNWLLNTDKADLDNPKEYNHRFGTHLNRRDILNMIKDSFPLLDEAYELKELYRSFNRNSTYEEAVERYDDIVEYFRKSNVTQYDEFTNILVTWKAEILNSFRRPYNEQKLSNAYAENINSKLRSYITVSKGVTNYRRFRARVLYALNDNIYYTITKNLTTNKRPGRKRGRYQK